uniref:Uncharacterized protein n=1 Tax=Arundo donax TaxID=35708 RepID=A0A0A9H739_ARUDO
MSQLSYAVTTFDLWPYVVT